MAKKLRSLLAEIDKKFKESEEVSAYHRDWSLAQKSNYGNRFLENTMYGQSILHLHNSIPQKNYGNPHNLKNRKPTKPIITYIMKTCKENQNLTKKLK